MVRSTCSWRAARTRATPRRSRTRSKRRAVSGQCTRTGPLKDLSPAFTALDLYVMTSRNEGFFPIALIEALERGVPVLAPTVGGIGTVLKDGEGGFLLQKPDDRRPVPEPVLCGRRGPARSPAGGCQWVGGPAGQGPCLRHLADPGLRCRGEVPRGGGAMAVGDRLWAVGHSLRRVAE